MGSADGVERKSGRGKLIVRPSRASDIHFIAANIRPADRAEIKASTGEPPLKELGRGYIESRPCLTVANGETDEPVAMFGVVPIDTCDFPRVGAIWLLGTASINDHVTQFLRESRERLDEVCRGYTIVGNLIDNRNSLHIAWLRWLGFKLIKSHDSFGAEGRPFTEFAKIVENPNV